jgi:hypothetical protein
MGPASSDAAAALQAAKELRKTAARKQLSIAASVKTWRNIERRVIDDPRGGMLAVTADPAYPVKKTAPLGAVKVTHLTP